MSMIGKTLGQFECTSLLGKGGMGEVYRAKDQKLGRDVAIKVLPEEFAKDADRVARFQREAKLLASLNHPNIAAIHGLEESDGTHFLVLELIEGDTLADRLKHGTIPVEESLKLALQIAEALEAAHEKGVIHRDLKPANIKVTPDGKVKVLDFGLAKAFAGEQAEVNLSHSPTLSEAATLQGVILGTAAYMSPEQARGKPVDKRTDIWAFGCVLYEMLTGQAAFQGEDVTEILAAVVKSGVNLDLLPVNIHHRVREVITRCLQKEQRKRYGGIGEAQYEIEKVLADPSGIFVQSLTTPKPRKKMRVGIPWLAAAIVLSLIVAGVAVWYLKPSEPRKIMQFRDEIPEAQRFHTMPYGGIPLAVSPDGGHFVYRTNEGLYLRSMDELSTKLIVEAGEDPHSPCFSPDGQWIAYASEADQKMKKVAISGGTPVTLSNDLNIVGASWSTDNTILCGVVGGAYGSGIFQVPANGGTPEQLFEAAVVVQPYLLPDRKAVLFTDGSSQPYKAAVYSIESGERKELFEGITMGYLPSGHILFVQENAICAIPFDLDTLETTGGTVPLIEGVRGGCAISDSGTLIYVPGAVPGSEGGRTLVWVNREGEEDDLSAEPADYGSPKISPDGTRVALTIQAEQEDIWVYDIIRENPARLTLDEASDEAPLWTPDGQRIVFASDRGGKNGLYWMAADGAGEVESISAEIDSVVIPSSCSQDGNTLVLTARGRNFDISVLSMEDDRTIEPLLQKEYAERQPQLSPDGQWIAYSSNESGEYEIYVRPFPDVDARRIPVSANGGTSPLWSPDGEELFYRNENSVMAVTVEMGGI